MKKQALILWEKIRNEPLLAALSSTFVLLLVLFLLTMILEDPKWIYRYLGLPKKNDALKFLGIGMGGVLLALQALMSYKRAKALEDTAKAQAEATEEQAKANQNTEQGQRQERLKNAIEHLGHEKDSVRLGGAYELFHLAEETEKWRQTILDILCAHIRQTTGEAEYREKHKSKPSEEVQSLMTLLFVQEHDVFKGLHINLQESWLNGANLINARLQRANLINAQLQGAYLINARLQGANLLNAQLQGAYLSQGRLQGANLLWARLQGANLSWARLQGAGLFNAQLQGVRSEISSYAPLSRSDFEKRMRQLIGEKSDLSEVVFAGRLRQEDVDSTVGGFSEESVWVRELRERLKPHIDQPVSHELPENSGAITGTYTAEEAEQWIAEYNEAISEVPTESDS